MPSLSLRLGAGAGLISLLLSGCPAQEEYPPFSSPPTPPCQDLDEDGYLPEGCEAPQDCAPLDPRRHPAALERCNGLDDDCDGEIDEGLNGGLCETGFACGTGRLRCQDGVLHCDLESSAPEICNGQDDDCDGLIDEGFALGSLCQERTPYCLRQGEISCREGLPYCQLFRLEEERCNGLDDDCDGEVDEGFPELGRACVQGQGLCRREGRMICQVEGPPRCSAEPGSPEIERCNGQDDDCDGFIDERLPCAPSVIRVEGLSLLGEAEGCPDQDGDGEADLALAPLAGFLSLPFLLRWPSSEGRVDLFPLQRETGRILGMDPWGQALEGISGVEVQEGRWETPTPQGLILLRMGTAQLPLNVPILEGEVEILPQSFLLNARLAALLDSKDLSILCGAHCPALTPDIDRDGDGISESFSLCAQVQGVPAPYLPLGGQPCEEDEACPERLDCRSQAGEQRCALRRPGAELGERCLQDEDCRHGLCAHLSPEEGWCTRLCGSGCPSTWSCMPALSGEGERCLPLSGSGILCARDLECPPLELCQGRCLQP